jgi:hypothetical protein
MNSLIFEPPLRRVLKNAVTTRCYCLLPAVILLLLVGLLGSRVAAGASDAYLPVLSSGPGPQFAVADFDGDVRPDLASIRPGSTSSGNTNYWIQIQLSTVGQQFIRLVAPAGGLRIEARDVNGDHAPDLVFATAWLSQPVAILLNDGHGVFSKVEPPAFPDAFTQSKGKWDSASDPLAETFGLLQSRLGICDESRGSFREPSPISRIPFFNVHFFVNSLLAFHAGRAPPPEISLL